MTICDHSESITLDALLLDVVSIIPAMTARPLRMHNSWTNDISDLILVPFRGAFNEG
jgi:hypothetical protein